MAIVVRNDSNKIVIGGQSGGIPDLGDNTVTLGNGTNPINGVGGDGTVRSVNGVLPDENGDVTVTGTGGTSDHNQLTNRTIANQHPQSAITGLSTELTKLDTLYPATNTFNGTTIPFNVSMYDQLNPYNVTSSLTVTPYTVGAIPGFSTFCVFIGDGTHTLDLTAFIDIDEASTTFTNTVDTANPIMFVYTGENYYRKHLPTYIQVADIVAPVVQTLAVADNLRTRIVLTYNETLDATSVPATTDFVVSGGKTISSVTVSGVYVNINVNSAYAYGDSITISYTAGSNPIQDVAGNNVLNLSNRAVANNIVQPDTLAPVLQSATVTYANPNKIVLYYNEALDESSVPSVSDYTPSGGKIVSSVAVSGQTVTITVNTNYISSDTITISYTSGTNPIRDMALNIVANLIGNSVTNSISNSAPVASALSITGTTTLGSVLTGHYTYSDFESDAEGTSTFRWLRNGTAIGSATNITYTLVLADLGTTTTFEVTPVAVTGTTPGSPATSSGTSIPAATAPTLTSAATSTDGLTVTLSFSKAMGASPSSTGLIFSPSKTISSITRQSGDTTKYDVVVSVAFANTDTITTSYTPGTIVANDGGVLAGFSGVSVTNNVSASIPRDLLMAEWLFTGDANDTSGNSHNGTVTGATLTTDRESASNSAYLFSSGSKIDVGTFDFASSNFSISLWYNSPVEGIFIANREGGGTYKGIDFGMSNAKYWIQLNDNLAVHTFDNLGTHPNLGSSPGWHHIVLVVNRSTNVMNLWENNVKLTSDISISSLTGYITSSAVANLGYEAVSATSFPGGKLDDIRIYSRVLTPTEIGILYNE